MLRASRALSCLFAIALPTAATAASPQSFKGEYTVSFLGLSIAKSTFSSHYENGAYSIDGTVSSAGLAKLFDDTRGTISSKGTVSGQEMQPQAFRADYTSGKKASMIDIRFADGAVTSTKVIPAPGKRDPKDWVSLGASDLKLSLIHICVARYGPAAFRPRRLLQPHARPLRPVQGAEGSARGARSQGQAP